MTLNKINKYTKERERHVKDIASPLMKERFQPAQKLLVVEGQTCSLHNRVLAVAAYETVTQQNHTLLYYTILMDTYYSTMKLINFIPKCEC